MVHILHKVIKKTTADLFLSLIINVRSIKEPVQTGFPLIRILVVNELIISNRYWVLTLSAQCIHKIILKEKLKFSFSKFFAVPQKVLWRSYKPFAAPQRSVKIKKMVNLFSSLGIRTGRDKFVFGSFWSYFFLLFCGEKSGLKFSFWNCLSPS